MDTFLHCFLRWCLCHSPYLQASLYTFLWGSKKIFIRSPDRKKSMPMPTIFLFLFSHLLLYQSECLDGCQAIGINSSFIFDFWALRVLLSLCWFFLTGFIFCFFKLSETNSSNHRSSFTVLLHISRALSWSGTYLSMLGASLTALLHISWSYTDQDDTPVTVGIS